MPAANISAVGKRGLSEGQVVPRHDGPSRMAMGALRDRPGNGGLEFDLHSHTLSAVHLFNFLTDNP
jgi:hypothetical protein